MKQIALTLLFSMIAQQAIARDIEFVNEVKIEGENEAKTIWVKYEAGGCAQQDHRPEIKLEVLSSINITPKAWLEAYPSEKATIVVTLRAKVVENGEPGLCRMSYTKKVEANLRELFKKSAPQFNIDLAAKNANYHFKLIPPQVHAGYFSVYDN